MMYAVYITIRWICMLREQKYVLLWYEIYLRYFDKLIYKIKFISMFYLCVFIFCMYVFYFYLCIFIAYIKFKCFIFFLDLISHCINLFFVVIIFYLHSSYRRNNEKNHLKKLNKTILNSMFCVKELTNIR